MGAKRAQNKNDSVIFGNESTAKSDSTLHGSTESTEIRGKKQQQQKTAREKHAKTLGLIKGDWPREPAGGRLDRG